MSGYAAQIRKARALGQKDKAARLKDHAEGLVEDILIAIESLHEEAGEYYTRSQDLAAAAGLSHGYCRQVIAFMHSDECDTPEAHYDFYKGSGQRVWHTELTDPSAVAWKSHAEHATVCKQGTGMNQRGNFQNILTGNKFTDEKKKTKKGKLASKPKVKKEAAQRIVNGIEDDPLAITLGQVAGVLSGEQMQGARTALAGRAKALTR